MKYLLTFLLILLNPLALAASAEQDIRDHVASCDAADNTSRNCNQSRLIIENLDAIGLLADRVSEDQGFPVTDSSGNRLGFIVQEGSETYFRFSDIPNLIGWNGGLTGEIVDPPLINRDVLIVGSCAAPIFAETTYGYSADNHPLWIVDGSLYTSEENSYYLNSYESVLTDGSCGIDDRPSPGLEILLTQVQDELYASFPLPWM
ncbi:MAG: hypothetical protein AAF993_13405, partial [Pseudomonadota bacterium]